MAAPTPRQAIADAIARFEGLLSVAAWDPGNWVRRPDGTKLLVGTMRGVTAAVYAEWIGVPQHTMTTNRLRDEVTISVASEIGEDRFYRGYGLHMLPWGPATEVVLDFAWGSGKWAIIRMQRLCDTKDDGAIGPKTIDAYTAWVARVGWEAAVRALYETRMDYYKVLERQDPHQYGPPQPGWARRAKWFLPDNPAWWGKWKDSLPRVVAPDLNANKAPVPTMATPANPKPVSPGAVVAAGAGAAGTAAAEAGLGDVLRDALPQISGAASLTGILKWVALALVLGGIAYTGYRLWDAKRKTA